QMALARQNIPLPLTQGADTKTDDYILPPGKLSVAQNVYVTSNGTVKKRWGHVSLGNATTAGGTLGAGPGLAAYQNELVAMHNTALCSYSAAQSAFAKKGSLFSCSVTQTQIARGAVTFSQQDSATNTTTGLQLVTWYNGTNILYSI